MKYIFILGNNPELSKAEITAVLPQAKTIDSGKDFLIVEHAKIDCEKIIYRLGGTIKIGIILGKNPEFGPVLGCASTMPAGKRFNFGFSFYGQKPSNIGMQIKGKLKEQNISSRLVTSREPALSSVIITKEKCHDFLVGPIFFGMTCAVQDFKDYSRRDFGRPASDALSGMLPPKAAKMMLNLAQVEADQIILDPFCGSGTILAEALALGYKHLIGNDLSEKAVSDSIENLEWLTKELKIKGAEWEVEQLDAKKLSEKMNEASVDAIVSEPYLGKPMKGNENEETVKKIIAELEELYLESFAQFKKILKPEGKIVLVIPEWHLHGKTYQMNLDLRLNKLGFKRLDAGNLIYKREDQKVWRNITIWEK